MIGSNLVGGEHPALAGATAQALEQTRNVHAIKFHDKQFYNNLGIGTSVLCGDCCWMIAHANADYTLTVLPIAH